MDVFGVLGKQEVSFAPNQLMEQGAKLVTNAEDVIRRIADAGRSGAGAGGGARTPESEPRNLLQRTG
jgi:predicted Rossmann fold nucleotide-binding protein DprA/Smf involved in DNA uptake